MSQGENDYEKDLRHLTSATVQKIDEGAQKTESFSSACIYRVPEHLRKLKESAYTPQLIAIGPLHREDKHLQTPLQHVKMSYTKHLLSRLTKGMVNQELEEHRVVQECLVEMKALIDDAKKSYATEVTLDEGMMLVDGCFILELLYRRHHGISKAQKDADPICGITAAKISYDLVLLENQIPLFVLEKLFQLTVARIPNPPYKDLLLIDYVQKHFEHKISRRLSRSLRDPNAKHYHILHILHDAYLPRDQRKEKGPDSELEEQMPSASDLVHAGVEFVPSTEKNVFNIQFTEPKGLFSFCQRARFEIPPLKIYDSTEFLLRNLIAFEQCYCCLGVSKHVSSYAVVMDMLVNSDEDVQVLEKARVLHNCLGASKDATDLLNNLTKEIAVRSYFNETCIKATQYAKRFWPKNMAYLRHTYFASPWTFIAFCIGFIAFVMSVISFVHDFLKKEEDRCCCQGEVESSYCFPTHALPT